MNKNTKLKRRFNQWVFSFHKEVMKTSAIGMKMLTASRTNAHLKDTYEELGRLLEKGIDNNEVEWDNAKLRSLLHTVKACKNDIDEMEKQINKIKFLSAPVDISKDESNKKD